MGLRRTGTVITNDAIVVLCFRDSAMTLTAHWFHKRAAALGFTLTRAQVCSMLHRAQGRIKYTGPPECLWQLTAAGLVYRQTVLDTMGLLVSQALTT